MPEVDQMAQIEPSDEMRRSLSGRARSVLLVVFALSSALHLYSWYVHPDRPSLTDDVVTGWYGGASDQINYAREARALANGQLPGIYWDYDRWQPKAGAPPGLVIPHYAYGLGYPMLGVPFIKLGLKRDPFLVPDMIAFGLIICMALLLARRFMSGVAALVFVGLLAVASPVLPFTVMPWNATITTIAILASLLFATSDRRDWKTGAALGLALSLCYAARFTDVLWPAAIVAAGALPRRRDEVKGSLAVGAVVCVMLAITYVAVGWTQQVVFGNFFTNPYHYHLHNGNRGDSLADFRFGQIPRAFTEVFVTAAAGPRRVQEPHTSVVRAFPWVVAAPFGLAVLIRRRHRHLRALLVAAAASLVASALYLAYWSGTGADLENNNLRFFVPWFPFWGLLAAVALVSLVARGAAALRADAAMPERSPVAARLRWGAGIVSVPVILALIAYASAQTPVEIDLMKQFGEAEKRPVGVAFELKAGKILGDVRHAIAAPPPSRFTWKMTVPDHAVLRLAIGIDEQAWNADADGVEFRIGVSHDKEYTDLLVRLMNPRDTPADRQWLPVTIDLEGYAGRRVALIFSTNTRAPRPGSEGRAAAAYWAAPIISGYLP